MRRDERSDLTAATPVPASVGQRAMSPELTELRDALEDAIRRAYCEIIDCGWDGHSLVGSNDPTHLRRLTKLQATAWEAVAGRLGHVPADDDELLTIKMTSKAAGRLWKALLYADARVDDAARELMERDGTSERLARVKEHGEWLRWMTARLWHAFGSEEPS